jgi:hypothetical protein
MVQSKVKVKSRIHVTTVGQSVIFSLCLVHSALKEFHPNEFESDNRRSTLRRNFLCYHWENCMWSMQCNVEFGHQLRICSGTKESHGKLWPSWTVAGPSGCNPALNTRVLTLVHICAVFFSSLFLWKRLQVAFTKLVSVYNLDNHQTSYNTLGRNESIYAQICLQLHIYL